MPTRPAPLLLLTTVGVALLAGLAAVTALGVANGFPAVNIAVLSWLTVAYSVSGLVAWRCRPASRLGPLMVLTGVSLLGSALSRAEGGLAHTVGQALDLLPVVLIVQVFLTFPTGRLHGRIEKTLVYAGYVVTVGGQLAVMLAGGLQPHLLTVVDAPGLATLLYNI